MLCMGAGESLPASAEGAETTGQVTGSWGWSPALNVGLPVTDPVSLHDPLSISAQQGEVLPGDHRLPEENRPC